MVTPASNKYAPPKSFVADVAAPSDTLEKASRGARFGASFLDGLLISLPFIPSYLVAIPALIRRGGKPTTLDFFTAIAGSGVWFLLAVIASLVLVTLTTIFVYKNGQTIGKKLVGIKVVRNDGSRASLARIFWLRYLLNTVIGIIPVIGSIYALIDVLFIFGEAKRCVHDFIADTIVVRA